MVSDCHSVLLAVFFELFGVEIERDGEVARYFLDQIRVLPPSEH